MPAFDPAAFDSDAFDAGGGGAQSVTLGLIDQSASTFTPTVTAGVATVSLALIDQTAAIFGPSLLSSQEITLGLIDQTAVALTPTLTQAQVVAPALLDQTATPFAPAITTGAVDISLGLIDRTAAAFSPLVSGPQSVDLGLLDQTAVAFNPSVGALLPPLALINQTATSFSPTVTPGTAFLTPGLINQTALARLPLVSFTEEGGGPAGPGGATATNHTRVIVDGLGNIAPVVIWAGVTLETALGGDASPGTIPIRDVGQTRAVFVEGARIIVDRGAGTDPLWTGYLMTATRRYFFSVDYPDALQRMWVLQVADINLLWSRRVIYKQSHPADIKGIEYLTSTWDDDALEELFANWVDLTYDDLDTSTLVDRVGKINYDQPTYPWNAGMTLGDAMNIIAQLPAAAYGIDPSRRVVYADVDDENAPFVLSDAFIPAETHPPPVFNTDKGATTPLYDPQIGMTLIGLLMDASKDPTDPAELADWNATGEVGPIAWLKMVLNTEANLRFDTFGSFMVDTQIFIYKKDGVPTTADHYLFLDDDSNLSGPGNVLWDFPFGYWRFNEPSGIQALDAGTNAWNGAYRNTPLLNQTASPGYSGQVSVRFGLTTVNEYVRISDHNSLDFTGTLPLTFETWIKWDGTGAGAVAAILGKGTQAPYLWLNTSNGKVTLSKADVADIFTTVSGLTANTWYHLALTYQNNTVAALYLNGVSVPITTPNYQSFTANANFMCFGSKSDGGGNGENTWRGWLSDVAIYNQIKTPAQILRHYQQFFSPLHSQIPDTTLTAYQHFDAGTYWIGIQPYEGDELDFVNESFAYLKIYRSSADTVYSQGGWEPVGSPGKPDVGYREMTINLDGTVLCNDYLAWGAGMGSPSMVFRRLKSQSSIDTHGLWQDGDVNYSIYKQTTINKVADSAVNGSPSSKRGRKNDAVSVTLVIHEDGLRVGDRVRFISHIWEFEDVLPVRKMVLSFATQNDVRYELLLSHEIDRWGFQDPMPPYPGSRHNRPPRDSIPPPVKDPSCVTSAYEQDSFNRTITLVSGPFVTGTSIWGGNWVNWVANVTGVLYFPGDDVLRPDDPGSGQRMNKVSDLIPDNANPLVVDFVSHSAGAGPGLESHGVIGPSLNNYETANLGPWSTNTNPASTNNNHIYYWFSGVYNPFLTGSGTYYYTPGTFANAGSSKSGSASLRYGQVNVDGTAFGVKQNYVVTAAWNRDTVTAKWLFRIMDAYPTGATWKIVYGAMTVEFDPGLNEIRIVTGSGTTTQTWTDWYTSTGPADDFYELETVLDLEGDNAIARFRRVDGADNQTTVGTQLEFSRAANGERVGDGDYLPWIGIWWDNPTAGADLVFRLNALRSFAYKNAAAAMTDIFDFTDPDWVQYSSPTTVGNDPGLSYGADGTISVVNSALLEFGDIRREVPTPTGSVNLGFCVSNYSTLSFRGQVASIFFSLNNAGTQRRNQANIGNSPSVTFGSTAVSSVGAANTLFTAGNPVNVRIELSGGGIRLKQWAGGTAEPEAWTAEVFALLSTVNGTTTPWPNIFIGVDTSFQFDSASDSLKLGPLQLPTGEEPAFATMGPASDIFPSGIPVPTTSNASSGRYRSWPMTGDDGGYAVGFGGDVYTAVANSVPSYNIGVVWHVFNPADTDGIPHRIEQRLSSIQFSALSVESLQLEFNVRVRGVVTVGLREARYEGVGATGVPGPVNVIIENFSYGTGAAIVGGVPNPPYVDYNILNGLDKWNAVFDQVSIDSNGPHDQSMAFDVIMQPILVAGIYYLQWGTYFYGTAESTIEAIEMAGPLWGGGFLFTPNNGTMFIDISSVTYELVPFTMGWPISGSQSDPCNPYPVGYDYGVPEKGRVCIPGIGDGVWTEFALPKFTAGTVDVIEDGRTLTPNIDYVEGDERIEIQFTTAPPVGAQVIVCCTVM